MALPEDDFVIHLPIAGTPFGACDLALLATVLVATYTDCRWQRIYNWLTLPAILLGWTLHAWLGGIWGLGDSLLGFVVAFGPALVVYQLKGIKGGDVKLIAAIGALGGSHFLPGALLATALCGGVLSLLWTAWHGTLGKTVGQVGQAVRVALVPGMQLARPLHESHSPPLPYGVAIAAGTLTCLFLPH
jgi:prepilin peptidase CpaA